MFHIDRGSDGVTRLRMDDGKVNAIGPKFVEGFQEAWTEASQAEEPIVLAGNERAFSAGLDLKVLPELSRDDLEQFFIDFNEMIRGVLAYPGPTVSAIQGPAIAGGAVLALATDTRLVAPEATMGLTEVRVAVPFPPPVLALARQRLPAQEHTPGLLAGRLRAGKALVATGWAHVLVPDGSVVQAAVQRAHEASLLHPATYAATKRGLQASLLEAFEAFDDEAKAYADELADPARLQAIREGFARAKAGR